MNRTYKTPSGLRLRVAAGLAGALMIAACASTPPAPTAQLQAAQQAIATAERADAGRHAAVELGEARTKLAAADAAVREEKMDGSGTIGRRVARGGGTRRLEDRDGQGHGGE